MTDVKDVLVDLGIRIEGERHNAKKGGVEYKARCPHHHGGEQVDNDPSWWINADSGKFICFSCGFTGDLSTLLRIKGLDPEEAKKILNRGARALQRLTTADPWAGDRRIEVPPMNEARLKAYADPPQWALDQRRIRAEDATLYGIRWDDKNNYWVLPIRYVETGAVLGMQVKEEGGRYFRNLPGDVAKSTAVFGLETVSPGDGVVVVESPLDAAYIRRLGYPAVALFGARASTVQIEALIARAGRLILALDDDAAGRKETLRLLGRRADGKRDRFGEDYSKRIPIWIANYMHAMGAKDMGDCIPSVARACLSQPTPAFRYQQRLLA